MANPQTIASKCLGCAKAQCVPNCPIGNDIPAFLAAVKQRDYALATQIIGHPFGEICGAICPKDSCCVAGCVLNKQNNGVDVAQVEQLVFAHTPHVATMLSNALLGKKIAVVGGGVSGITFATKVAQHGATVTLYEKSQLLSTLKLIPNHRLNKNALERITSNLHPQISVVQKVVDEHFLAQLRQQNDVVYLATGLTKLRALGVTGEQLATDYATFLTNCPTGKNVVVVGGGNTAMDCATLAAHNGCNVTVAYRRSKQEMPCFAAEYQQAEANGVQFCFNFAPTCVQKCDNGTLALHARGTVSQQRGTLNFTEETRLFDCDVVVCAVGASADLSLVGGNLQFNDVGNVGGNLFVGGDFAGGSLAAHAVRDALRTANHVLALLQ